MTMADWPAVQRKGMSTLPTVMSLLAIGSMALRRYFRSNDMMVSYGWLHYAMGPDRWSDANRVSLLEFDPVSQQEDFN
jgi:hypothetical protein